MGDAGLETEGKPLWMKDMTWTLIFSKPGTMPACPGVEKTFISAVSPEISVIEVGAGNNYGHPTAEILERLQKDPEFTGPILTVQFRVNGRINLYSHRREKRLRRKN